MKKQIPTGKQNGRKKPLREEIEVLDLDEPSQKEKESRAARRTTKKSGKTKRAGRNREFAIITYLFLGIFLLMIGYFVYFQVFKSESVISSSYNPRLDLYEKRVTRGDILSADGKVLAETKVKKDGSESREYPYGRVFAHVVGYSNNGKGGIEAQYNFNMLRSHSFFLSQIWNDLNDRKNMGDSVVTTLDTRVQQKAYDALGEQKGAVVVLEPKTGKVLAMVSKPDFDPNTLADEWKSIVSDNSSSVLLNRAVSGLYPPGSTFKIFTTLEYVHENPDYKNYRFTCEGSLERGNNVIHCYHNSVHGKEDLADSFANSCNTSYSNIGLTLNISKFHRLCESLYFNQSLPGSIQANKSKFSLTSKATDGKIMQTSIGQGDTLVTPLHMAFIAAAIANDGMAMEPYLVQRVENDNGVAVKKNNPTEVGNIIDEKDAKLLQKLMKGVVQNGTGQKLKGQSYQAAGKTGSAEYNSQGDSHGWFVGYGSKKGYQDIAIAVIVEDGGSGSQSAVPVAKQIFDMYFNQIKEVS